jgi:NADH:ubiquinone oxidoreductase subunit 4 (subunit M)
VFGLQEKVGGLISTMPMFSTIFLFFILPNMSLFGTNSFIGKFLILVRVLKKIA